MADLDVPYGYTVHDLNFACPTITFLAADGLYCGGVTDNAVCRRCLAAQPAFDGFDIGVIRDAAGLEDHIRAAAEGFGFPEPFARAVIGEKLWARDRCTVYDGYEDDAPISAGFSVRTGRTLGIFTIATVPAARGRGHGSAMTARVVADGVAVGCDVATLQASEEGRPIYERFRLVQEYDLYVEPRD